MANSDETQELPELPRIACPVCGKLQTDFDGLGFQYCQNCEYCTHPNTWQNDDGEMICGVCGILQSDIDAGLVVGPAALECATCKATQFVHVKGPFFGKADTWHAVCPAELEAAEQPPAAIDTDAIDRVYHEPADVEPEPGEPKPVTQFSHFLNELAKLGIGWKTSGCCWLFQGEKMIDPLGRRMPLSEVLQIWKNH